MAPQPPEIVGQIVEVMIAHVVVGDRLRPVDPIWAAALGKIMAVEGQKTPIEICQLPGHQDYLLVAGGHRLEGARLEGWKKIRAIIVDSNALDRRHREISENLWRKGLDPIDRAAFVAELISISKTKAGLEAGDDGRAVSAKVRWADKLKEDASDASVTMTLAYGWAEGVADQIGLSRKTIYRDLELHRGLRPDLADALRGQPVATNAGQLRALAKMSEADQRAAVSMILEGAARSVTEAGAMLSQKAPPSPETKAWSAFFGGWSRMSAAKRVQALRELAEQGLPKGVTINFGDDQ